MALRILEFALIFVGIPLLLYLRILPNYPIPILVVFALGVGVFLRWDPTFTGHAFWNWPGFRECLPRVLARSGILCGVLGLGVYWFAPHLLFSFPKANPRLWLAVMILYPLLSVYPQELIYRAFFFHRYAGVFGGGWGVLVASAVAFGFVHIIFGNWLSVVLTLIGGLLFGLTYRESGSLALTSLEHAIFGNFLFTIGLGQFFYHGARR